MNALKNRITMASPKISTTILLFGAGAVGTVYLYLFERGGATVTAVCRSNYEAAKAHGFYINSAVFGSDIHFTPRVVPTVEDVKGETFDYVVVCSKAFPGSKPSTAETIKPAIGPKTSIVLIQNGIGIEEEYKALFPDNTVLSCVVYLPATQVKPGHIEMGNLERLEIGPYPTPTVWTAHTSHITMPAAKRLQALIQKAGGTAEVTSDIQIDRWKKLLINASWNPICALARSRDVAFMASSPLATEYVRDVMLEVVGIGRALGYPAHFHEKLVETQLDRARQRAGTKGVEPSMMTDVLNGRRLEVEAILGNTIKVGKEKGCKVDKLMGLYVLTKALDESMAVNVCKAA
ncbi:hypothetical protein MBLNU459_g2263t2 [Dothideomycetes sp. NU459]